MNVEVREAGHNGPFGGDAVDSRRVQLRVHATAAKPRAARGKVGGGDGACLACTPRLPDASDSLPARRPVIAEDLTTARRRCCVG